MNFLDKLKNKPEGVRKQIAFFATFAIFSVITSVWWTSWTQPAQQSTESPVAISDVVSPLGVVVHLLMTAKDQTLNLASTLEGKMQYSAATDAQPQTAGVANAIPEPSPQYTSHTDSDINATFNAIMGPGDVGEISATSTERTEAN